MTKIEIEIIYQDDDILVINKPSGISVTKDRSNQRRLTDFLTEQLMTKADSGIGKLRLIHRLDKDTSGVMLLAKNRRTQRRFTDYFANKKIKKTYLTLIRAVPPEQEGIISAPLGRGPIKGRYVRISRTRGKDSLTQWRLIANFGSISLLAAYPITGRTHQIRVHLPSIGLPLAIDPLYGNKQPLFLSDFKGGYHLGKNKIEKPLIDRLTLHAYQIELLQPQENCPNCFIAGLDKKFATAIKMLTKYNQQGLQAFLDVEDYTGIINSQRIY